MKILNLFAGIGGNRTLWGNKHEITAIENNQQIALIYHKRFPNDDIIIGDAYNYCLWNYDKFEFIWASPPCPTHSICNNFLHAQDCRRYPDMGLWQLILFLRYFSSYNKNNIKYIVENPKTYYKPLIYPTFNKERHYFWSNCVFGSTDYSYSPITITNAKKENRRENQTYLRELEDYLGIKLPSYLGSEKKIRYLRNCVRPGLGKLILDQVILKQQKSLIEF